MSPHRRSLARDTTDRNTKRWAFLSGTDIGSDGDPYLDRLRIVQTPWFAVYLHHIHRPDIEPVPHDHPWWFASLVLTGSYTEKVWPDKRGSVPWFSRKRRRGSLRCLSRRSAHMITKVEGSLWTLVLTGPRKADWGFWDIGEFIPWQQYFSERGCGA